MITLGGTYLKKYNPPIIICQLHKPNTWVINILGCFNKTIGCLCNKWVINILGI